MAGAPSSPFSPTFNTQVPPYPRWYHDSDPRPESASRRFVKAFALASAIYLLLAATVESLFRVSRHVHGGHPYWYPRAEPSFADGEVLSCHLGWSNPTSPGFPGMITATTSLPIKEASMLFFHSTGSHSFGTIHFVTAEPSSLSRGDFAVVDFHVKYWDYGAWDSASVCAMRRREREYGIGIYTSNWWTWGRSQLVFDVKVTLPASQARPLILGAIETQLSLFSHEFGDLTRSVYLDAVHLQSTNAQINVKSVSAKSFDVHTTNAAIDGSFNVTDRLSLVSSNGHIDVAVRATNDDWEQPTRVFLSTSNAYIAATASLLTSEGGKYVKSKASGLHLTTSTTNGHLEIDIPTAPPNSRLDYFGTTSNNRARLTLPPAFEGEITSKTSNSNVNFHHNPSPKDPTGDGRTRHFGKETHAKGSFGIETWWGNDRDEHTKFGNAHIQTSNAAVTISL